jgi:hypothetical protein
MYPNQEVDALRKKGHIDEAYRLGYKLIEKHPEDQLLRSSFGWVVYDKVKILLEEAKQAKPCDYSSYSSSLQNFLREYAKLRLSRPDLLFSLLLLKTLQFPEPLKFLPKFVRWAGIGSFSQKDLENSIGSDGKVFESLVEKTAKEVGKVVNELTIQDYQDLKELQEFAITLIDYAFKEGKVQKPEWLNYRKALLLKDIGRAEEAQKLLILFVQKKRSEFWAWHELAKIVEISDPATALGLYAKACLTCRDPNFCVGVFEDLGRLAASQNEEQLAKWATEKAFTIRNQNKWKIPSSLRSLLETDWYARSYDFHNSDKVLLRVAAAAESVLLENCLRYNANYLCTFATKNKKEMVKFGLLVEGDSKELVSPIRNLLNELSLEMGAPVIVIVDESGTYPTIVGVEKRESGNSFDSMSCKHGHFRSNRGGFGFVDDVYVPHELANKLKDGQAVSLATVRKLDKKKNRWGLTAVALLDKSI